MLNARRVIFRTEAEGAGLRSATKILHRGATESLRERVKRRVSTRVEMRRFTL